MWCYIKRWDSFKLHESKCLHSLIIYLDLLFVFGGGGHVSGVGLKESSLRALHLFVLLTKWHPEALVISVLLGPRGIFFPFGQVKILMN